MVFFCLISKIYSCSWVPKAATRGSGKKTIKYHEKHIPIAVSRKLNKISLVTVTDTLVPIHIQVLQEHGTKRRFLFGKRRIQKKTMWEKPIQRSLFI